MSISFGIHIGNTNAYLAICKDEKYTDVIVNNMGERMTPAVVAVGQKEILVGNEAKIAALNIGLELTMIQFVKSLMNVDEIENKNLFKYSKAETLVKNGEICFCIDFGDQVEYMTVENVMTHIFLKLMEMAKSALHFCKDTLPCVLLVPQHFSDESCTKYRSSAEAAGWAVLQVINESAAAVLAYSLLDSKEPLQNILVYRLGGRTCEVVIYELSDGMLAVLGSEYTEEIGGNVFVDLLANHLADEFFKRYKLDAKRNLRSMEKLRIASEKCVQILSKLQSANCFVESLCEGIDLELTISTARFEHLIQPVMAKFTEPIERVLNRVNLAEPITHIVLSGGGTKVKKLQNQITGLFNTSVTSLLNNLDTDEVLATGAARQAYHILHNNVKEHLPRSMLIPIDEFDSLSLTTFSSEDEN